MPMVATVVVVRLSKSGRADDQNHGKQQDFLHAENDSNRVLSRWLHFRCSSIKYVYYMRKPSESALAPGAEEGERDHQVEEVKVGQPGIRGVGHGVKCARQGHYHRGATQNRHHQQG